MKTISAISFEEGAYRKTYPNIGKLAMLREVEHIATKLILLPVVSTILLEQRVFHIMVTKFQRR